MHLAHDLKLIVLKVNHRMLPNLRYCYLEEWIVGQVGGACKKKLHEICNTRHRKWQECACPVALSHLTFFTLFLSPKKVKGPTTCDEMGNDGCNIKRKEDSRVDQWINSDSQHPIRHWEKRMDLGWSCNEDNRQPRVIEWIPRDGRHVAKDSRVSRVMKLRNMQA